VPWNAGSTWRPFCSKRCKLIDLGDWAAEWHVIRGTLADRAGNGQPQDEPGG
jgi:endogenous inhibitor of DNA gyrase (YacG/DUF329 family)